jgi:hypothetical protein
VLPPGQARWGRGFEALEGLVYPGFEERCGTVCVAPPGQLVGGIDFGFRNPFAAIWGVLDKDDVLWIDGERYGPHPSLPRWSPGS